MTILERLRAATGPDRELDFWISARAWDPCDYTDEELQADIDIVGIEGMVIDKPFTASIDAALGLVERLLPGCSKEISFEGDEWYFRFLSAKGGIPIPVVRHVFPHKTAPLAILTALFAALEAKERT